MPQCCGLFIHKIIDSETKKCSIIYANEYVCVYELLHYDCVLHHSKPFCNALITAKNKGKKIKENKDTERKREGICYKVLHVLQRQCPLRWLFCIVCTIE